jgi:hypothetical protein
MLLVKLGEMKSFRISFQHYAYTDPTPLHVGYEGPAALRNLCTQ